MPELAAFSIERLPRFVDISCVQAFHRRADIDELARAARDEAVSALPMRRGKFTRSDVHDPNDDEGGCAPWGA